MAERMTEEIRTEGNEEKGAAAQGLGEESAKQGAKKEETPRGDGVFEGIYDRMPDISLRALDRFILLCVIALIAVVLVGILRANHVF